MEGKKLSQNLNHKCIDRFQDDSYGFSKSIGRDRKGKQETLETIWEVPDEIWGRVEPITLGGRPAQGQGPQAR